MGRDNLEKSGVAAEGSGEVEVAGAVAGPVALAGDGLDQPVAAGRPSRRKRGADKVSANGQPSARRLAANRANALRSTGPRSEMGKRIARYNALRHGLAAQASVLPGEDEDELLELTADIEADHGGGSAAERLVASRLVAIAWKLRRLARAEEDAAEQRSVAAVMAWSYRRAHAGKPMPAKGHEFEGPDPMPMPEESPRIVTQDMEAPAKLGTLERLGAWELKLGGQMMAVCRQLVTLRKAMADNTGDFGRMPTAADALRKGEAGEVASGRLERLTDRDSAASDQSRDSKGATESSWPSDGEAACLTSLLPDGRDSDRAGRHTRLNTALEDNAAIDAEDDAKAGAGVDAGAMSPTKTERPGGGSVAEATPRTSASADGRLSKPTPMPAATATGATATGAMATEANRPAQNEPIAPVRLRTSRQLADRGHGG